MGIQAVIMAGGEGTRLRPLTCDLPKPLVPVLGRPVMAYTLELLRRHGVKDVAATIQYLPDQMKAAFGDGGAYGVNLRFYRERTPQGTAGSVRMAQDEIDSPFFVLSGDGLTDCDLSAAMDCHKSHGALATIVLRRVEVPLEYGVVIADGEGHVRQFVEKPGWSEVYSDTVNTGIYVLSPEVFEYIPRTGPFDFGRDLFPLLVRQGMPVCAYVMDGYWCDIGDQAAYVRAQEDMLEGRVNLPLPAERDAEGNVVEPGACIQPGALVEAPCYIGTDALIQTGSRVGAHSCIGAQAVVEAGATVKRSVVWPGARIMEGAQLRGAVVCRSARMQAQARMFEGSALGDGSVLEDGACLPQGVKVWPHKRVMTGLQAAENVVWGDCCCPDVRETGIALANARDVQTVAAAWAHVLKARRMALLFDGTPEAQALYAAAGAALMTQGVEAVLLGEGRRPKLRALMEQLLVPCGLFIAGEGVQPLAEGGLSASDAQRRNLQTLLSRQDFAPASGRGVRAPHRVEDGEAFYTASVARLARGRTLEAPAAVFCPSEFSARQVRRTLELCGARHVRVQAGGAHALLDGETGFVISKDGERIGVLDAGGALCEQEMQALRALVLLDAGERTLVVPMDETQALDALSQRQGARVERVRPGMRGLYAQLTERALWLQRAVRFDALASLICHLAFLSAEKRMPRDILRDCPRLYWRDASVSCALKDKGRILRALCEEAGGMLPDGGVRIRTQNGWATLYAPDELPRIRIFTESEDAEFARELCAEYSDKVRALVQGEGGSKMRRPAP